jgi:hypothetical protein
MNRLLAQISLLSLLSVSAYAQVSTGRLSGTVVDATGAAVPNATVNLTLADGAKPLASTITTSEGIFNFPTINPGVYSVEVESQGFTKFVTRDVRVAASQQLQLPTIKLEISATAQTVEITADVQNVQVANAENSTTITQQQIVSLPVLDRQVTNLLLTQPGVSSGRGPTVINGLRTSGTSVTQDGINIQDNFIRTNALDYIPTRVTIEQVQEVTVTSSNANTALGNGASQVVLVTPSGSNEYHGSAYWYNKNSYFGANDWFNNQAGVERSQLNQNQLGGSLRGRIIRDKLFFFTNYEAFRLREQSAVSRTILRPDARTGVFTYRDTAGQTRTLNLLQARGIQIDPYINGLIQQLPTNVNNPNVGDGLNTGGYLFNARDNTTRDAFIVRGDYYLNDRNLFTGVWRWNTDVVDRPDLGSFLTPVPPVYNDNTNKFLSTSWRWTASPTFINEVRYGFNLAPGLFATRTENPEFLPSNTATGGLVGGVFAQPVNGFLPQGRETNTYAIQDNATWTKGKHTMQFGFQSQLVRTSPFNDGGIVPAYTLGISAANTQGFVAADFPGGISAQQLTIANNLFAALGGYVSSANQTFNVTSRDSGFVRGATNLRELSFDTHAGYFQDNWRLHPRLTLTLGMRYEYYTRLDEKNGLFLIPRLSGNVVETLMNPNAVLDFAGGDTGRPYYKADTNNFAPNLGFAYDVFGDGRTAIRGGYSMSFINDDTITAVRNNLNTNNGLTSGLSITNQTGRLSTNRPQVPVPTFQVPLTQAQQWAASPTASIGLPNPDLATPVVHQWTFGIQHEIKNTVIEVRYVGNRAADLLRAYDWNQVNIYAGGFFEDFLRARNNGFLAQQRGLGFDPNFNANIPGSQQLTVFPQLGSAGLLNNATVRGLIQTGEPGSLAETYQSNRLNGPISFFPNPNALGANTINNDGYSLYNALQLDVRRRIRNGMQVQANYTFSKVLSNTIGNDQARFEPFLDINNPGLENARAPFDINHVIKANYVYQLPFGSGQRWSGNKFTNAVFGGWNLAGFIVYQSGTPFSVFSNRGTLNRSGLRATERNTASINGLSKAELDRIAGSIVMTGNGPFFINPAHIGSDGRGTAGDGLPAFQGQVFFNPDPGTVGNLQRRMFSGPWTFNWDASVLKTFRITESQSVEFRAEAFNVLNTPSFWVGNETTNSNRFNINNATFGRVTSTFNGPRVMQFGLYYRF